MPFNIIISEQIVLSGRVALLFFNIGFYWCAYSELGSCQQELHARFELPEDRPYFRKANAFRFPDQVHNDGYLRNPHQVLTHPNLDNGKVRVCITFTTKYRRHR